MEKVKTNDLILELIRRGAIKIVNKNYFCKRVYIEERYKSHRNKSVPKEILVLDNVI